MSQASAFVQFQQFLREMFQYDNNDLDFGLFKVLRLKRNYIEQFISGDSAQDLKQIVQRELAAIRSAESEDEREILGQYLDNLGQKTKNAWAALQPEPNDADKQAKLKQAIEALEEEDKLAATLQRLERWLATQKVSVGYLEAQLYNYLLNFFELYYQNGDFGYNSRASSAFKVPYETDYDGSDTLFHWKHKDSYYIKTGASFPEVKLDVLGQNVVFRMQAGGEDSAEATAQNNNKESDIKHYRLVAIEQEYPEEGENIWVVRFVLAKASTFKAEIYAKLWQTIVVALPGMPTDITAYLLAGAGDDAKSVFNDLGKDHDKAEGGQIKGINQLRMNWAKYRDTIAKHPDFRALGSNNEKRTEALETDRVAQALYSIDRALNRFYVGQDADYFIHKDLRGYLTHEKDRFIKNIIFSDLDTLLARQLEPATLIIARGFNAVAVRIIEFLDVLETFQRNLYTLKKKVVDTHWLISVGKIDAAFYPRLLDNLRLVAYWASEFQCTVGTTADVFAHPTLVVDTSLFTSPEERALVAEIIGSIDHLDEQTDGLLIHSENWQALNLLQEKFRERIQCIYIDPPYNTGGDGFLYKDSFRHSSWISMITDRLALGRELLKGQGYLFSSIDRDEHRNLLLATQEVFGNENFIEEFVWQKSYGGGHKTKYVNNLHEYIIGYAKNLTLTPKFWLSPDPDAARYYKYEDEKLSIRGRYRTQPLHTNSNDYRKNLTYPIPIPLSRPDSIKFNIELETIRKNLADNSLVVEMVDESATPPVWRITLNGSLWIGGTITPEKQWQWSWDATRDALVANSMQISVGRSGLVVEYKQYEFGEDGEERGRKPSSIQIGPYTQTGTADLTNVIGFEGIKFPKPTGLIEEMIGIGFNEDGTYILDFFAGSGTTGHAAISLNKKSSRRMRKFILTEVGEHFSPVLKRRISRLMYSLNWSDGLPKNSDGWSGIVKIQALEQYEDVLANLNAAWNEVALPEGVPVQYLFRPEQNKVQLSLDMKKPFDNTIKVGKQQEAKSIDLLESWGYLQGYWLRSRRVFTEAGRRYECLETECGTLVVLRDITEPEDDSAALKAIVDRYVEVLADGTVLPRLRRLELNHWANLMRMEAILPGLPCAILNAQDFDRGAEWI